MNSLKLGFVIVNYNSTELCLDLANYLSNFKSISTIVIVDNMSNDNAIYKLKEVSNPKIKTIFSKVNGGYSAGNNIGMTFLSKKGIDIAFIANPDIMIDKEDILNNMVESLILNPDLGAISTLRVNDKNEFNELQYFDHGKSIEHLLSSFAVYRKFFSFQNSNKIEEQFKIINHSKSNVVIVDQVPGSFFCMRVKDWEKINRFDENLFLYFEEIVLARKLEKIGLKCGILKTEKYKHNHNYTNQKGTLKKYLITASSKKYYIENYMPASKLLKNILIIATDIGVIERTMLEKIIRRN
ncbi:glycosyltransferase family 2 protein [Enterococcus avium]|uniref:glycosyltransferase family 2 protein n=1 Tax=Enterococcus avium TaxID=33945 RepID=UPI002891D2E9|nr:glycosyltransferase family 2 protein [Enterococcus avium]MDT2428618.1 glycosyltransferase family 2 protein [Enterococcus avium]MDT2490601.1 glycosyltransferase family 2 protein [Enterococcus avium]